MTVYSEVVGEKVTAMAQGHDAGNALIRTGTGDRDEDFGQYGRTDTGGRDERQDSEQDAFAGRGDDAYKTVEDRVRGRRPDGGDHHAARRASRAGEQEFLRQGALP